MTGGLLTTNEAAVVAHREPVTIRKWVQRGYLKAFTRDHRGRPLYLEMDVLTVERDTRHRNPNPDLPKPPEAVTMNATRTTAPRASAGAFRMSREGN